MICEMSQIKEAFEHCQCHCYLPKEETQQRQNTLKRTTTCLKPEERITLEVSFRAVLLAQGGAGGTAK